MLFKEKFCFYKWKDIMILEIKKVLVLIIVVGFVFYIDVFE